MKVIMLSGDSFILDPESNVHGRITEYGTLVSELHIILLSKKILADQDGGPIRLDKNIWVYPIRSVYRSYALLTGLKKGIGIIRKISTKNKETIITAQDPFEIGFLAWLLASVFKLPLQLQVHNDFYNPYLINESTISHLRRWLGAFLIPKATSIRVVSNTIRNSLTEHLNIEQKKINLLPVFVNASYIADRPTLFDLKKKYPQFKNTVLMVGRLGKQKNYPLALVAFKKLLEKNKDTGLVILGEGPEDIRSKRLVNKLGLNAAVVFEGRKNDVISYYKSGDVFLHSSNYEGYGMVFIEAAAAGIPIVSTDVGIMSEVFVNGDSAFIVKVEDAEALAANIDKLLNDARLRQTVAANATKALTQHTFASKEKYLEKYKESWQACLDLHTHAN